MREPGTLTADYDFVLPADRIAQTPTEPRDQSRLLVLDRSTGAIAHRRFSDLADLVPRGDIVVLNRSRVRRARLLGTRATSGAPAEILLLTALGDGRYEAMVSPGGKLKPGRVVDIGPGFSAEVLEVTDRRTRIVRLMSDLPIDDAIQRFGHVPLPPYITRGDKPADSERYQTVYARELGSAAAPTAGLHFTLDLLDAMDRRGVRRAEIVLHVGAGTFKPVEVDDPGSHVMHEERYAISDEAAQSINSVHDGGGKVWAVGTTTLRTLETASDGFGTVRPGEGSTRLFVRPPYRFCVVDRMITNFHLPRSTLIMLVAAFAGYRETMQAYREAIDTGYRFYSYGDAMVVV